MGPGGGALRPGVLLLVVLLERRQLGNDKGDHGGVDFLPWWLNQIYWLDKINGARTLDVFDIHAYADANTAGLTTAQLQALAASGLSRLLGSDVRKHLGDYQPELYHQYSAQSNHPLPHSAHEGAGECHLSGNAAVVHRVERGVLPGSRTSRRRWAMRTPMASSGREGCRFAARWGAPVAGNPNYRALKLYTNYDGAHHGFGTVSVSDLNTGNPNLFSSYAALNATGTAMTIMVSEQRSRQHGTGDIQPERIQCDHLHGLHADLDGSERDLWPPVRRPGARRKHSRPTASHCWW